MKLVRTVKALAGAAMGLVDLFALTFVLARAERDIERARPPIAPCACCVRGGRYNGFGSDGPTTFQCPKGCFCHD